MITVYGGSKNQRKYALSIAAYVCQKFNIEPTVDITFKRMTTDSNYGYCLECDEQEYELTIKRSLSMREMLQTVAHEMVHVKQYYNGELTQENESHITYWDKPSEIEALGRELGLFISWIEKNKMSHLQWARMP